MRFWRRERSEIAGALSARAAAKMSAASGGPAPRTPDAALRDDLERQGAVEAPRLFEERCGRGVAVGAVAAFVTSG